MDVLGQCLQPSPMDDTRCRGDTQIADVAAKACKRPSRPSAGRNAPKVQKPACSAICSFNLPSRTNTIWNTTPPDRAASQCVRHKLDIRKVDHCKLQMGIKISWQTIIHLDIMKQETRLGDIDKQPHGNLTQAPGAAQRITTSPCAAVNTSRYGGIMTFFACGHSTSRFRRQDGG